MQRARLPQRSNDGSAALFHSLQNSRSKTLNDKEKRVNESICLNAVEQKKKKTQSAARFISALVRKHKQMCEGREDSRKTTRARQLVALDQTEVIHRAVRDAIFHGKKTCVFYHLQK